MITVKRLVARLKQIERMGDTDASKRRAVLSTPLCERVASSQAENEVPAKIRILRLLDRNILPHEKVIDAYPELSEPVKRIIRKMLDRDHWLIGHWWGGYFPHVAFALADSSLSFAGQLLGEAIHSDNPEPNCASDVLHAYYRYHFKRAGILDKETEKVLSDLFAVSFWQFGFFSSSLDNIGRGGVSTWNLDSDWKAKHVLLPFPRSLQEIVYPMASGGYIGHQAPALAILIYFQRRDFVQTLKDSFRSTANRLTVPLSEADKAALGGKDMFWPFGLPSDLLISRLLNLVVAIRHLTEDEDYGFQFYDFAMSSFLRSRTTSRLPALSGETDNLERPHTPEFLAEVHKLALELIST